MKLVMAILTFCSVNHAFGAMRSKSPQHKKPQITPLPYATLIPKLKLAVTQESPAKILERDLKQQQDDLLKTISALLDGKTTINEIHKQLNDAIKFSQIILHLKFLQKNSTINHKPTLKSSVATYLIEARALRNQDRALAQEELEPEETVLVEHDKSTTQPQIILQTASLPNSPIQSTNSAPIIPKIAGPTSPKAVAAQPVAPLPAEKTAQVASSSWNPLTWFR